MKVTIIGLGYVGFPLLCVLSQNSLYEVYGFDISENVIQRILDKKCHVDDELAEGIVTSPGYQVKEFSDVISAEAGIPDQVWDGTNTITVSTNPEILKETDIFVICVPTPVDEKQEPDLRPIQGAANSIRPYIKRGSLVILESTVNPGVCQEFVQPILEESGLTPGQDFYFAYCPERINPGDAKWNVTNIPRNVGALTQTGLQKAYDFYSSFITGEIKKVSSIKVCEASKIVENTFRDINIAFVNELAQSFDVMGIDVKEVIDAAATKPFAFIAHYPSCGVGGHCIPVDPYYLIQRAGQSGFNHKFLKLAREINNSMPLYTVNQLDKAIIELKKSLQSDDKDIRVTRQITDPFTGALDVDAGVVTLETQFKIGLFGLAYKKDISDMRESPALKIRALLEHNYGIENVQVFDPYLLSFSTVNSLQEFLDSIDILVIATNHSEITELMPQGFVDSGIMAIIDGKNCLDVAAIKMAGIKYKGIGR